MTYFHESVKGVATTDTPHTDTCALFAGGIVSLHVGDDGARLVGVGG